MQKTEPVTFTELLYSVVIGTAITRIDSLELTQANILLLVALLIIFDDYFLYHHAVTDVEHTSKNAIGLFWLDMVVLLIWYAVAISTQYSLPVFFFCVSIFFISTSIWELIFSKEPLWKRVVWESDFVVFFMAQFFSFNSHYNVVMNLSFWSYVTAFLVFFAFWRWRSYKEIWNTIT